MCQRLRKPHRQRHSWIDHQGNTNTLHAHRGCGEVAHKRAIPRCVACCSPLFIPTKTGEDKETQILPGELFNFDLEVEPILEVLVGKTLEQGLMEVLEEEELENIRLHQEEFEQIRNAELAEVQRLEEEVKRKQAEKVGGGGVVVNNCSNDHSMYSHVWACATHTLCATGSTHGPGACPCGGRGGAAAQGRSPGLCDQLPEQPHKQCVLRPHKGGALFRPPHSRGTQLR